MSCNRTDWHTRLICDAALTQLRNGAHPHHVSVALINHGVPRHIAERIVGRAAA